MSLSNKSPSINKRQANVLSEGGHFSLIRALHLADVITLMNGFCGVMSIFWSMTYCISNDTDSLWTALAFLPAGLLFDFLDGRVARWRNKSSLMGQELDSLADLISFGVAPASAAFALGLRTHLDTIALSVFVLCGLLRLARFNVTVQLLPKDASGKSSYFEGTPIPTSLALDALMALCLACGAIGPDYIPGGVWAHGGLFEVHPVVILFLVHGCLMTSRTIRIPKL